MAFTILPYYYPTRSRVSTRSSLCPTAVLLHPLAQYVDPIALLACLLQSRASLGSEPVSVVGVSGLGDMGVSGVLGTGD